MLCFVAVSCDVFVGGVFCVLFDTCFCLSVFCEVVVSVFVVVLCVCVFCCSLFVRFGLRGLFCVCVGGQSSVFCVVLLCAVLRVYRCAVFCFWRRARACWCCFVCCVVRCACIGVLSGLVVICCFVFCVVCALRCYCIVICCVCWRLVVFNVFVLVWYVFCSGGVLYRVLYLLCVGGLVVCVVVVVFMARVIVVSFCLCVCIVFLGGACFVFI